MSSGPLPRIGHSTPGIKLNRPEVDVLVEVEPEAEQDSLFEDSGRHVGMADGAEQDGVAAAQPLDLGVGQDLAGPQVALAPQVERRRSRKSKPSIRATAESTSRPSAVTSGPTPSPATTPSLIKTPSAARTWGRNPLRPSSDRHQPRIGSRRIAVRSAL